MSQSSLENVNFQICLAQTLLLPCDHHVLMSVCYNTLTLKLGLRVRFSLFFASSLFLVLKKAKKYDLNMNQAGKRKLIYVNSSLKVTKLNLKIKLCTLWYLLYLGEGPGDWTQCIEHHRSSLYTWAHLPLIGPSFVSS